MVEFSISLHFWIICSLTYLSLCVMLGLNIQLFDRVGWFITCFYGVLLGYCYRWLNFLFIFSLRCILDSVYRIIQVFLYLYRVTEIGGNNRRFEINSSFCIFTLIFNLNVSFKSLWIFFHYWSLLLLLLFLANNIFIHIFFTQLYIGLLVHKAEHSITV
jgi:hypothetical protein